RKPKGAPSIGEGTAAPSSLATPPPRRKARSPDHSLSAAAPSFSPAPKQASPSLGREACGRTIGKWDHLRCTRASPRSLAQYGNLARSIGRLLADDRVGSQNHSSLVSRPFLGSLNVAS